MWLTERSDNQVAVRNQRERNLTDESWKSWTIETNETVRTGWTRDEWSCCGKSLYWFISAKPWACSWPGAYLKTYFHYLMFSAVNSYSVLSSAELCSVELLGWTSALFLLFIQDDADWVFLFLHEKYGSLFSFPKVHVVDSSSWILSSASWSLLPAVAAEEMRKRDI